MIKRIISILLVVVLVLSVASCGNNSKPTEKPTTSSKAPSSQAETLGEEASEKEEQEEQEEEPSESVLSTLPSEDEYKNPTNGKISVPATAELTFKALPADHSVLLNKNPDRGWRSAEETNTVPTPETLIEKADEFYTYDIIKENVRKKIQENTLGESVTVSRVYFIMSNYDESYDLPQVTIDYINNYCKAYKELGVKMYMGIYYMQTSGLGDPENWEKIRISTIYHHVEKYWAPLWARWEEAIYAIGFALLGRYGEWTSLGDSCLPDGIFRADLSYPEIDLYEKTAQQKLAEMVLRLAPQDLRICMRNPYWKTRAVSKDNPRYYKIGFSQDAFYGKYYPDNNMGQGYWLPNNEGGWWAQGVKEAPYSINDAEFFTSRSFVKDGVYIPHETCIQTLSELRVTTMSINHSYADYAMFGVDLQKTILQGWKSEEVTPASLKELGVLHTDEWFIDRNGETIKRNAFEYVRDHLGYRISAQNLAVTGGTKAGESINLNMSFKNYGFSAVFNLKSGFAILDENNNVVSTVYVGDPTTWHSTSPEDYSDRTQLTHNLSTSMKLPDKKGIYKIAFFLKNKLGQTARLDNTVEYTNGYNILHMFTID